MTKLIYAFCDYSFIEQDNYDCANDIINTVSFNTEDKEKLQPLIFLLLKENICRYNGIDSLSVSVDRAKDLLESLMYTMEIAIKDDMDAGYIIRSDNIIENGLDYYVKKGQEYIVLSAKSMPREFAKQ